MTRYLVNSHGTKQQEQSTSVISYIIHFYSVIKGQEPKPIEHVNKTRHETGNEREREKNRSNYRDGLYDGSIFTFPHAVSRVSTGKTAHLLILVFKNEIINIIYAITVRIFSLSLCVRCQTM
ncbi:unnamed protein product [Orchesella dallaii]|uniref:Uncharacterized protein n=1 Tax=Orchesella dallaii TaxID=48710 RepID=A0ABP1RRN0_9HEXA